MATINKKMLSFFFKWEGGLSRDTSDSASSYPCPTALDGKKGYHTNKGITYKTWVAFHGKKKNKEFLNMTDEDVIDIFKKGYWDKVKADKIKSDAIAVCLTSWAWGSGSTTAIIHIQRLLGLTQDGIIGKITLGAINECDEVELFDRMVEARRRFFQYITNKGNARTQQQKVRFSNNGRFLRGWLRRLGDFNLKFRPQ